MTYTNFHGELHEGVYVDQQLRKYFPDYDYQGIFFHVGAFDPITISNSHHFYMNGWTCYEFEAIPENVEKLMQHRSGKSRVFQCAVSDEDKESVDFCIVHTTPDWTASYSALGGVNDDYKAIFGWHPYFKTTTISVQQRKLNTIIEENIQDLMRIDILSIDVEGHEIQCLKGLDLSRYKPRVIVIENVKHTSEFHEYLSVFGYRCDKQIAYNYFFVSDDLQA